MTASAPSALSHPRFPTWTRWLWGLLFLPFIAAMIFTITKPILVLPRAQLAPGFILTDHTGQTITSEDLRGRLTLVNFTYTHCAAPACPQTTDAMADLWPRLDEAELGDLPLTFLTISFDAERDTPEQLAAFAANYPPASHDLTAPRNWLFASNASPTLTKSIVGNGYRLWYELDASSRTPAGDYAFDFRTRYFLVDGWGVVRATYTTPALDVDLVLRDLNLIATEVQNSTGAATLAYEAAHLFRCYP